MSHLIISPPDPTEYASYYGTYISLVRQGDIITALTQQIESTLAYLRSVPKSKADFRYAPGKWTIKQVVAHIIDSERVFAYRALTFARNDSAELPGFEQEDWMNATTFDNIQLGELIDEFEHVRKSTILFFKHLSKEAWMRKGIASNNPFTVRSLAYSIAGHELHHMEILKSRYA